MRGLPILIALTLLLLSFGCEVEDPVREDVPELITKVTLTFTPTWRPGCGHGYRSRWRRGSRCSGRRRY